MKIVTLLTWLCLVLMVSACAANRTPPRVPLAATVLANTLLCKAGVDKPSLIWADTASALHAYRPLLESAVEAQVDFDTQTVLVLMMGRQPSSGYRINLLPRNGVSFDGKILYVFVGWHEPAAGSLQAQAITRPKVHH